MSSMVQSAAPAASRLVAISHPVKRSAWASFADLVAGPGPVWARMLRWGQRNA